MSRFAPALKCAALFTSALSSPLFAQIADQQPVQAAPESISNQNVMADDRSVKSGGGVTDIVVTARRREESIQNVPVSVTAFSSQALESRNAREVDDLLGTIPNVNATDGLQIRGIGYNTRNIGIEAGATVYVDGVYTGRPSTYNQDLADVASVQVLRGPQGTLYGKNSIAGVIAISTKLPEFDFEGHGRVDFGNRDRRRVDLTVNVPLADNLAIRTSASKSSINGWIKDLINDQVFGGSENTTFRTALRWDPTPDLQIVLRADHQKIWSNPREGAVDGETLLGDDPQYAPPRPIVAPGKYTTVEDTRTNGTTVMEGGSLTIEYSASSALKITSITGYRYNKSRIFEGEDSSALNEIEVDFSDEQKQLTEELRASGSVGRLDYVAGFYYFNQKSSQHNKGILGTDFAIPPLGIPAGADKIIDPAARINTDSVAAFVDLTYELTDKLELTAGGRLNKEKKNFAFKITSDAPALFYVVPFDTDSFTQSDFSPTFGVRYHVTRDIMTYFRYAKGYKSGGWNADFISTSPGGTAPTVPSLRFGAENAETYEIGAKTSWFNHHVVLNGSVFQTNFDNLQVAQFFGINIDSGSPLSVTGNAGKARIKGFELETTVIPFEGLTLSGGVGYLDARYLVFNNVDGKGANANGNRMVGVPDWTGNASIIYSYPLANGGKITARGDYQSISARTGDPLNDPLRRSPGSWSANARLTYAAPDDRWQLSLFGSNIFDRHNAILYGIQQFAVDQNYPVRTVNYAEPRTYGVSLEFNF